MTPFACYHHPLSLMPALCDESGGDLSLTHALDCHKDGLFTQHHNEVRDTLGDWLLCDTGKLLMNL